MARFRQNYSLYSRKLPGGKVVWYYRTYTPDGVRTSGKSTGESSKTKAHLYCQKLLKEGRLYQGSSEIFASYAQGWFVPGQCAWLSDRMACGIKGGAPALSENYIKLLQTLLRLYVLPYFADVKLEDIRPSSVKLFRTVLQDRELSNKTINSACDVLHIMTDWAMAEGLMMYDPFRSVKRLTEQANVRQAFTFEQIKTMLSIPWSSRIAWLFNLTAAVTGMRFSEIRAIRRETLYPDYIDVQDQYLTRGLSMLKTKESRKVPIPPKLYILLSKELESRREFVFTESGEKRPMSRHGIISGMEKAMPTDMRMNRISSGLSFHSYRHFFNTYLLAENVPPHKVRAVMGHSEGKGTMTEAYTNWRPEMFPEIYRTQEKLISFLEKEISNI